MPFKKMIAWLEKEKSLGSPNPNNIILATAAADGAPHSRVVAIREIVSDGILFFTQSQKRKTKELLKNPNASMTLWLPLQQREVILDGRIQPLSNTKNENYWHTLSREQQLLFRTYSLTSEQEIQSISDLEQKRQILSEQYKGREISRNECYIGFKLIPHVFYFYTLGVNTFSELIKYTFETSQWKAMLLSP